MAGEEGLVVVDTAVVLLLLVLILLFLLLKLLLLQLLVPIALAFSITVLLPFLLRFLLPLPLLLLLLLLSLEVVSADPCETKKNMANSCPIVPICRFINNVTVQIKDVQARATGWGVFPF